MLDRVLGMAFGAARGAVIVSAAYLGLTIALAPEEQPEWIRDALVLPYVQEGAGLLQRFVPETPRRADPGRCRSRPATRRDLGRPQPIGHGA